ncbi:Alkyl transferase [Mycena venus]|uniref:Alkyl transferase n=1 Tax=Mycena venus TaxID=2733690 RepID=A0A8H6Y8D0_9AGAR|nr:Alkyl transferase [Mycena venus]
MLLRALRWIRAKVTQKAERLLLRILAAGPIPKHVAFVMDGNRRYARSHQQPIHQGHSDGFVALRRMLEACLRLERTISLWKCRSMGKFWKEYGVRLNVLGKTSLLPEYVQEAIRHVESVTRNNNKAILNICMSYSSQDEMTTAVDSAVRLSLEKSEKSNSDVSEITEDDIDAQLFTSLAGSPPLDILIRTSGVKRLSDFLLWQCSENTQIHFSKTYWPEFGLWDFIPILLDYQRKAWGQRIL